jgi:nucleotide-binding universal stress UspA family protein
MYTVLLPVGTDGDSARKQAEFVVELPDAAASIRAVVTHAFEGEEDEAPTAMQRPDRVGAVREAVEFLEDAGVETSVRETSAPAADGICDLAGELDVDQIVISGRRVNPVGKAVFGSVAQDVLIDADCPVTLIGAEE